MPPRKGKRGKGRGSKYTSMRAVKPSASTDTLDKVQLEEVTSEDERAHVEKLAALTVPEPPPNREDIDDNIDTSVSGDTGEIGDTSTTTSCSGSTKRKYIKSSLTDEQEAELVEFIKENPCLYSRKHKLGMNAKHKELLKRNQAQKMGIKGENKYRNFVYTF